MSTYSLPYFGELDLSSLEHRYNASIEIPGKNVSLDLNFAETSIDPVPMHAVKQFILNLTAIVEQNRKFIREDFDTEGRDAVREYLQFHIEESDEEELNDFLGEDDGKAREEQFFNVLHLVRVGFYPELPDRFAVCDYSIGKHFSQYLLVVILDESGDLLDITMES